MSAYITLANLLAERSEKLAAMDAIKARRDAEKRTFTTHEREEIRSHLSRVEELNKIEESGEFSLGRKTHEDSGRSYNPTAATLSTPTVRGGKRFADMFGSRLSNGGWNSFDQFLGVLHSGLHHPALQRETLAMSGGVASAGGYMVPEEHVAMMLDKSLENEIVRPRCQVEPMLSDVKKISGVDSLDHSSGSLAGLSGVWGAELDSATDQEAKFRLIQLNAKKLFIYAKASNELIADGMSFEQVLGEALIAAIGWHLDYACLRGTGSGQPLGVLNDPALVTISKEAGQAAGTIIYENLAKMFARIHPACINNSVWVVNQSAIPQLLTLVINSANNGTHQPVLNQTNGQFSMLSRPVIFTEKLPTLGTKGDILLADFSQYTIGLRKEVSLEKSIHVGWQTDSTGYRTIMRADGQGRWASALTPRAGDTLSWCSCIETRS